MAFQFGLEHVTQENSRSGTIYLKKKPCSNSIHRIAVVWHGTMITSEGYGHMCHLTSRAIV